ncbi:hypothetical protein ABIB57_005145 [Devosia sp. UYZn731]|uniref:nuclear transport factor 2 family protein n=1 Tax=Devosia sp. UYZn731 TaxID=3156345 RepID=UPI00339666E9
MTDALNIANAYLATWNETDADRRAALLGQSWSPTASYRDPLMAAKGAEALGGMIGAVQERFPGFVFTLLGPALATMCAFPGDWVCQMAKSSSKGPISCRSRPGRSPR